jgi:hypothetical protein
VVIFKSAGKPKPPDNQKAVFVGILLAACFPPSQLAQAPDCLTKSAAPIIKLNMFSAQF